MEADLLLQAIEVHLRTKVEAAGGTLAVADNPWDVAGMLAISPAKWRVILSWDDEDSIEDQCRGGWVNGTLSVFVQTHRGFEAKPGLTIHRETPAGRTAVTRRVAQVRRWCRAIQFEEDDIAKDDFSHLIFEKAQWIDGDDKAKPWRCRRMDFTIVYALDDPATDTDGATIVPIDAGGMSLQISGNYLLITSADGLTAKRIRLLDLP